MIIHQKSNLQADQSAGLIWLPHDTPHHAAPRESSGPKQTLQGNNAGGASYVDQADNNTTDLGKSICKRSLSGDEACVAGRLHARGQRGYLWSRHWQTAYSIVSSLLLQINADYCLSTTLSYFP